MFYQENGSVWTPCTARRRPRCRCRRGTRGLAGGVCSLQRSVCWRAGQQQWGQRGDRGERGRLLAATCYTGRLRAGCVRPGLGQRHCVGREWQQIGVTSHGLSPPPSHRHHVEGIYHYITDCYTIMWSVYTITLLSVIPSYGVYIPLLTTYIPSHHYHVECIYHHIAVHKPSCGVYLYVCYKYWCNVRVRCKML